mmetsp:Transcript_31400/g.50507  ORF Transcript_31400/g.50507 Transcript_31400/m.50507 type:complete len:219 (+) Transcript_31400:1318-1974(+)
MTTASTKSQASRSSSVLKTAQDEPRTRPSSAKASLRAESLWSATATMMAKSARRAKLRICSLPMAPVPRMPILSGFCTPSSTVPRGGPRRAASTRRGGLKVCLECMARVLSIINTSPRFHRKATSLSDMNVATARIATASTGVPSPSITAFSPTFLESFQPVKAATTELKKTRFPLRESVLSAGRTAVIDLQSPLGSHSHVVPCLRMDSSASSRLDTP